MRVLKQLFFSLLFVLLVFCLQSVNAEEATDITSISTLSSTDTAKKISTVADDSYRTYISLAADGYLEIELPKDIACGGLYVNFNDLPASYTVQHQEPNGEWQAIASPDNKIANMFIPLHAVEGTLRIVALGEMKISKIHVFGLGDLPAWVQTWKYMEGKADLMLIVAHPDDELVFLGGTLPYYCGQLHKKTMVVYMTTGWVRRRNELLDGLWTCGVRDYPQLFELPDGWSKYISYAYKLWGGRDSVYQKLAAVIRQYQPDVVVTQDIVNGETKHGMHLAVAEATAHAVELASNSDYDANSLETFGPWQVKKLYMHLYKQNKIVIPWDTMELSAFGGKTAYEVAQEAFEKHKSQKETGHKVYLRSAYDSRKFGLYFSTVGNDINKNDFFENINQ